MEGAKKPDPDQDDRTINLGGAEAATRQKEGDEKHPNHVLKYRIWDPWEGELEPGTG